MFAKFVVLEKKDDELGNGIETVTIGIFDEKGILQLEIPKVSGKIFPKDITKGKQVVFTYPASISNIK